MKKEQKEVLLTSKKLDVIACYLLNSDNEEELEGIRNAE